MDYDPQPVLNRLSCPALAFYGESDEWMPIDESVKAWRDAKSHGNLPDLTVARLSGADHLPTLGGHPDPSAISTEYSQTSTHWITDVAGRAAKRDSLTSADGARSRR